MTNEQLPIENGNSGEDKSELTKEERLALL